MILKKARNYSKKSVVMLTLSFLLSTNVFAQTISVNNLNDLQQAITTNMLMRNSNFTINYKGDTAELQKQLANVIKQAYSVDDYLRWSWSNYNVSVKGYTGNVDINFTFNYYLNKEQEDYVNQQTQLIVNQLIKNNMSDYEKVKILNDYVVNLVNYDKTLQRRTAYDALVYKSAVCQGYASLLDKLLEKAGIESIIVGGSLNGTPHAWNLVKVDGSWYHVDATNNDVTNNKYFLVSDNFLMQNNFTWDINSYPKANTNYSGQQTITSIVDKQVEIATNLVVKAEQVRTTTNVAQAEKAITLVSDVNKKQELTQRINRVKYLITVDNATKYVVIAEKSLIETDLNKAYMEVNKLAEGEEKTALLQRLDAVKQTIENKKVENATNLVVKAEQVRTISNVAQAEKAITLISDVNKKQELTQRINRVKYLITVDNATRYVVTAEKSLKDTDLNKAYMEVNKLAEGEEKTALLQRLNVVKQTIENKNVEIATNLVVKAEQVRTTTNVAQAEKAITLISDINKKQELTQRINRVKYLITVDNATKYVVIAEKSLMETDLNKAYMEVNKLAEGEEKTALLQRLNVVKQTIENKNVEIATNLVVKAEQVRTTTNVAQAEKAITLISDINKKQELTQRINRVKYLITVDNATKYVVIAEKSLMETDLNKAYMEVNKLAEGEEKTALLQRLDAVKQTIENKKVENATNLVVKAEQTKNYSYINQVEKAVNLS